MCADQGPGREGIMGDLARLGLEGHRASALAADLGRLTPGRMAWALALAKSSGPRAAEALRTAADVLPSLPDGAPLRALDAWETGAALTALAALPRLLAALGPTGLTAWLELGGSMPPAQALELAERSPGMLAGLGSPVTARLALRLARLLAPAAGGVQPALRLACAARAHQRPRVLLGLALRLAQKRPQAALDWLAGLEQGPAAELSPDQLCRWFLHGFRRLHGRQGFFSPASPAALAAADLVGGGLSLGRLSGWLGPYASLHAGRPLRLSMRPEPDPTLPGLDLQKPELAELPRRLAPDLARPLSLARALAFLAAAQRRAGLFDLTPDEMNAVLEETGRCCPRVQSLPAPALFCSSFDAPHTARRLLALALEAWAWGGPAARLPGVARDLSALRRARLEYPRRWETLEPATRVLILAAVALAGGERPADVLPMDYDAGADIAAELARLAPGRDAAGLYRLCARLYPRLGAVRALPPPEPAASASAWGTPKEGGAEPVGLTPSLNGREMPGPGDGPAPSPWGPSPWLPAPPDGNVFPYPEWDPNTRRLEPGRALVAPEPAVEADPAELMERLAARKPLARRLQKAFQKLAPTGPAWTRGHSEGPELDLNAAVDQRAEVAAGLAPRSGVFLRRRPRARHICCGVLWDVSGSTRRSLGDGQRRVIGASREALALFAGALAAAGDDFALWAFSGVGAGRVEFFQLKGFTEPLGPVVHRRLAGQTPRAQNRDGAALRHATNLLTARPARRRLLIIITDGRPDDYGYGPEVHDRDLPLALSEARTAGVRVVAVLLTPRGRTPHQAYRRLPHLLLPDVGSLAGRLPALYHRLTS